MVEGAFPGHGGFHDNELYYDYIHTEVWYHSMSESTTDYTDWQAGIENGIRDHEAFDSIIRYRSQILYTEGIGLCKIRYYDDRMLAAFELSVASGRWITPNAGRVEAVIGGSIWPQSCVGDSITLANGIEATVVGHLGPYMTTPP